MLVLNPVFIILAAIFWEPVLKKILKEVKSPAQVSPFGGERVHAGSESPTVIGGVQGSGDTLADRAADLVFESKDEFIEQPNERQQNKTGGSGALERPCWDRHCTISSVVPSGAVSTDFTAEDVNNDLERARLVDGPRLSMIDRQEPTDFTAEDVNDDLEREHAQ